MVPGERRTSAVVAVAAVVAVVAVAVAVVAVAVAVAVVARRMVKYCEFCIWDV